MKGMKNILLLLALVAVPMALQARSAKGERKEKTAKVYTPRASKVKAATASLFGYAMSLSDSTVYLTDIQRLDSVYLDKKSGFLMDRQLYSMQLQAYLEDSLHLENMTTAVFFHKKPKKAEKKHAKVEKHNRQDGTLKFKRISADDFHFYAERWIDTSVPVGQ